MGWASCFQCLSAREPAPQFFAASVTYPDLASGRPQKRRAAANALDDPALGLAAGAGSRLFPKNGEKAPTQNGRSGAGKASMGGEARGGQSSSLPTQTTRPMMISDSLTPGVMSTAYCFREGLSGRSSSLGAPSSVTVYSRLISMSP